MESGFGLGGLGMGVGMGAGGEEGEATVTTRVGTSPSGFEEERRPAAAGAVPESIILRQQTVEQHRHQRRDQRGLN